MTMALKNIQDEGPVSRFLVQTCPNITRGKGPWNADDYKITSCVHFVIFCELHAIIQEYVYRL